jgi:hypothetical protein
LEAAVNIEKIVGLIAIALAVLAAFVAIPHADLVLLLAGLVVGWSIAREDHVRVIVSALALTGFSHLFSGAPEVGQYLSSILANGGLVIAGASIMIILRNTYGRFAPTPAPAAKPAG